MLWNNFHSNPFPDHPLTRLSIIGFIKLLCVYHRRTRQAKWKIYDETSSELKINLEAEFSGKIQRQMPSLDFFIVWANKAAFPVNQHFDLLWLILLWSWSMICKWSLWLLWECSRVCRLPPLRNEKNELFRLFLRRLDNFGFEGFSWQSGKLKWYAINQINFTHLKRFTIVKSCCSEAMVLLVLTVRWW